MPYHLCFNCHIFNSISILTPTGLLLSFLESYSFKFTHRFICYIALHSFFSMLLFGIILLLSSELLLMCTFMHLLLMSPFSFCLETFLFHLYFWGIFFLDKNCWFIHIFFQHLKDIIAFSSACFLWNVFYFYYSMSLSDFYKFSLCIFKNEF